MDTYDIEIEAYDLTTEGSVIMYHCRSGLVPYDTISAICHANGSWSPNPATHRCLVSNTSLEFTTTSMFTTVIYNYIPDIVDIFIYRHGAVHL